MFIPVSFCLFPFKKQNRQNEYNPDHTQNPKRAATNNGGALVREVTKNLMVTLTELQSSSVEDGSTLTEGRPSLQHSTNQAFMVEWPDGSHSSVKGT